MTTRTRSSRRARRALTLAAAATLAVAATGCTDLRRAVIRSEVRKVFTATLTRGTDVTQVGPHLYSYRWMTYRTAFVATPDGVILFDPINADAARGVARAIEQIAPNPNIRYVVYSHFHRDHASGAAALPGHPVILAHANAARELAARSLPDVAPPTETFAGEERDLELGGEHVRLMLLPESHTDGLLMMHVPADRALYEVDIVWPHQLPPPGVPDMSYAGVERATQKMMAVDFDTLVPGHGAIGTKRDVVRYHQLLVDLDGAFRASLRRRGLDDLTRRSTFERGADDLADVFFDVEDALRPRYGDLENFDAVILPTSQWCFWHVLTGT
ncbi:MAG TPA: MBL fold metallo-hydrolase [Minicystis sp.]|nr:MBL fold metallo-hydrolase [Minicystis sp.]